MKRENTQLISDIIKEFIKEERLEEGLLRTRLFSAWDIVVGENGARATTNKQILPRRCALLHNQFLNNAYPDVLQKRGNCSAAEQNAQRASGKETYFKINS